MPDSSINGLNSQPSIFDLAGNKLTVIVETEDEFLTEFEEYFWKLMHTEKGNVCLDISRCRGLADDAFRIIALNMFEIGYREKDITIRVPENLERFFRHSTLYRVADIEVVRLLGKEEEKAHNQEERAAMMNDILSTITEELDTAGQLEQRGVEKREADLSAMLAERFRQTREVSKALGDGRPTAETHLLEALESSDATVVADSIGSGYFGDTAPPPATRRTGEGRLIDRRSGQVVEINESTTRIGRLKDNDILIKMPLVSKRHARITRDDDGTYFIEDLNSANGTYVNGLRLAGRKPLSDGTRIQIAITSQYPNGAKEYTFRQETE